MPPLVQMYFLNMDLILLVTYPYSTCFYSVVLIKNVKKLINIYIFFLFDKRLHLINLEKCHYKGKNKIPCKSH